MSTQYVSMCHSTLVPQGINFKIFQRNFIDLNMRQKSLILSVFYRDFLLFFFALMWVKGTCVLPRNAEAQGQGCPRYDEAVHAELRQGADELGTTSAAVDSSSSIFPCASASADHGRFTAHIWKRKRYG